MSKYRPLKDYLLDQTKARLELTLAEIEEIIGQELPPSAYAPRWWITGKTIRQLCEEQQILPEKVYWNLRHSPLQ